MIDHYCFFYLFVCMVDFRSFFFFFFNDTATTEIYTLSLHDALPISWTRSCAPSAACRARIFCSRLADRKSTRLNSSHSQISYAVFCLKKKKKKTKHTTNAHRHKNSALAHTYPGTMYISSRVPMTWLA